MESSNLSEHTAEINYRTPSWFMPAAFALILLGILVSSYSTYHHLLLRAQGQTDAFCNINASFNCDAVAKSEYAEIFGIPLGVFGVGFFLALGVTLMTGLSRNEQAPQHRTGYFALSAIGVVVSVILFLISSLKVGVFCPTCLTIYGICILNFAAALGARSILPRGVTLKDWLSSSQTPIIVVAATLVIFQFSKSFISPPSAPETPIDTKDLSANVVLSPQTVDLPLNLSAYSGLGEDYRLGNEGSKVTIVEFADFQCPSCANMATILHQLHNDYPTQVMIVFKNYPLDSKCNSEINGRFHDFACTLAIMARCSGEYGKFWDYLFKAYADQSKDSEEQAKAWAKGLGVTDAQIAACMKSPDILSKIKDDVKIANSLKITGTPTLYINNRAYVGPRSYEGLKTTIDKLLAE